ncbi:MAG: DNA helicase RecQ [Oscillospiraceae bacterium]|nr:DNA helicase RecQ [Oscillospiraceae bacterium]
MDKQTILHDYFGYDSFRDGQEQLIDAILAGRDAFGVMPTGGGKSLCYQVPAMLLPGLTFVVSPLIALMQDQVTALKEAGIPAAYVNSSLNAEQLRRVFSNIRAGCYRIVYVAPERLETESFLRLVSALKIDFLAVDEAHCISQWGQDFRPSYLKILQFIRSLQRRPVVAAFTATATEAVRQDVVRILELQEPLCVVTGFDRPNLRWEVLHPQKKLPALLRALRKWDGQSGIVYCATRKNVEKVCDALCLEGVSATRYHAGLDEAERRRNQEDFVYDRKSVMVATNAFGMGIDKSNVRFVIHYNMPKSIEAYYQEAGRAGRDGEAADCVLLYSGGDVQTARFLIENSDENEALTPEERAEVRKQDLFRLGRMVGYCKTDSCLRGYILDYFGQTHPATCGNCGNCLAERDTVDVTRQAQMILSCVKRIENRLGYTVGATLLSETLRGSRSQRVASLGLDALSTYGLLRTESKDTVRSYIEGLERQGYLRTDPVHHALRLTEKANGVLFHGEPVTLSLSRARAEEARRSSRASAPRTPIPARDDVFEALRKLRREIADREQIAAYMVFSDATLRDMAARLPRTEEEFLHVSGVGNYKLEKYGAEFLNALAEFQ